MIISRILIIDSGFLVDASKGVLKEGSGCFFGG